MSDTPDPFAAPQPGGSPGWAPLTGPAPTPYAPPQGEQPGGDPSAAQWGAPQQWGGAPQWGPPGRLRSTGTCVLLTIVTLGIYTYVYNYKVHSEMKAHGGRGVGGGVALVLTFVAGVAMPFVTSSEVGGLYARRGEKEPVNGWTGLWLVGPAIVGYLVMFTALIALSETLESGDGSAGVVLGVVVIAFLVVVVAGALIWFVKTNGALNRYWASLGVT